MLGFRKKIIAISLGLTPLLWTPLAWPWPFLLYLFVQQGCIYYFTRPIGKIMEALKSNLPFPISLESIEDQEVYRLGSTFNALNEALAKHRDSLSCQREEMETILASLKEGIIATDTSAKVTFMNKQARQMLQASLPVGALLHPLSTELAVKCHELILEALQTAQSVTVTLTLRSPSLCYLDLTAMPLSHQKGALLVLQDRTSDYQIVELGKDFIANASHELRTPITIIRGFAETLQDVPNLSSEMFHQIIDKIVKTCIRLDKLVRSLLTLSDIEHLSLERLRKSDLVLLLENSRHHLLAVHPSAVVTFHAELSSAFILADPDLLELAILNLLENSVRYSTHPAQIEMKLIEKDGVYTVSIQDRGIGIAEADLPYIFDRFYTVDKARSRKSGGAGLGLSIVKTVLEKHKGSVAVASEIGKGSCFTLAFRPVEQRT